jgi:hypothetical protein
MDTDEDGFPVTWASRPCSVHAAFQENSIAKRLWKFVRTRPGRDAHVTVEL